MNLDKSIIGMEGEVSVVEVEKGHVRQFTEAIGDLNPIYFNEEYAANTAYAGTVVPPTFPIALRQEKGGVPLKLDHRRMLHGEQEFIYYRPIRIGDRLFLKSKVTDLYEREGKLGIMQFLVLDIEMKDENGDMVAISRTNIIYRAESE